MPSPLSHTVNPGARPGGNPYLAFAVTYAFYRVFNYINQHLFEKHRVEIHWHLTVAKAYFEVYIPANAQALRASLASGLQPR